MNTSYSLRESDLANEGIVSTHVDKDLNLYILASSQTNLRWPEFSRQACTLLHQYFRTHKEVLDTYKNNLNSQGRQDIQHLISAALNSVHRDLSSEAILDIQGKFGSKASLTVILLVQDYAFVAQIGATKALLIRDGHVVDLFKPLTKENNLDHLTLHDHEHDGFKAKSKQNGFLGDGSKLRAQTQPLPMAIHDTLLLMTDSTYYSILPRLNSDSKLLQSMSQIPGGIGNKDILEVPIEKVSSSLDAKSPLNDQLRILKNLALFEKIKDDYSSLYKIHSLSTIRTLQPNEKLMTEGDSSEEMFVILSGSVNGFSKGKMVYKVEAGSVTGEIGVFNDEPRSFSAIAAEPTEILVIRKSALLSLMNKDKELGMKIYAGLVYELSKKIKTSLITK